MRRGRGIAVLIATTTLAAAAFFVAPASAAKPDLPPSEVGDLAKVFKGEVKPLGLRVTRGMLQDLTTYEPDPNGTHLALYVAPTSASYSTADYLKNFTKLTHKFIPMVFDRWKGLQTFDICQEPFDDSREAPPPVTQIFVSRDALDRVGRWQSASLSDLLAAAPRDRRGNRDYYVYFRGDLRNDPIYTKAAVKAGLETDPGATGY